MRLGAIREALRKPWTLTGQLNYAPTRQAALQKVLAMKRIGDAHAFAILGGAFSPASKEAVIRNIVNNNDFTSRRSESFDGQHYAAFPQPWDSHLPFLFRWLQRQPAELVDEIGSLWRANKAWREPDEYLVLGETRFELERAFTIDLGQENKGTTLICRQYHSPARRMLVGLSDQPGFKHDAPYSHETVISGCYVKGRPFYF